MDGIGVWSPCKPRPSWLFFSNRGNQHQEQEAKQYSFTAGLKNDNSFTAAFEVSLVRLDSRCTQNSTAFFKVDCTNILVASRASRWNHCYGVRTQIKKFPLYFRYSTTSKKNKKNCRRQRNFTASRRTHSKALRQAEYAMFA